MQCPDVVGVMGAALHPVGQAEVVAIHLFGFLAMALIIGPEIEAIHFPNDSEIMFGSTGVG